MTEFEPTAREQVAKAYEVAAELLEDWGVDETDWYYDDAELFQFPLAGLQAVLKYIVQDLRGRSVL